MQYFRKLFLTFLPMVIGSSKASADLPLPMINKFNDFPTTETREFLITSDGILLIGFLLWIAYIVLFFPSDTLRKQ